MFLYLTSLSLTELTGLRIDRSGVRTCFMFWPAAWALIPPWDLALLILAEEDTPEPRLEAEACEGGGVPWFDWLWRWCPEDAEAGWMETLAASALAFSAFSWDCRIFFKSTSDISSFRNWVCSFLIRAFRSFNTSADNSWNYKWKLINVHNGLEKRSDWREQSCWSFNEWKGL